ncbi:hypothetical protein Ahy_A06g027345 [Arachis hypogaea]|uniref:Uncharacterized protein n=1 Tax=Arachis hypogaea TaxID=3818 RepID=A0A445CNC9_ARAHY|nr:hypothetical protein Ahy_A06g027345 [Arachis hypogaea]
MEIVPVDGNDAVTQKCSYKESLLTGPGLESDHETFNVVDDEPNPEDMWYNDEEDEGDAEKPFNPCPTIPVSKEEFEEWCKPWKNALIVKVLGKRVSFTFMEQRLRRDWEGKGKIHVIDMNRDYFLVHFSDEEDYAHVLMEGTWMVAGHYLIVQRSEQCMENVSTSVNPMEDGGAGKNSPVEETAKNGHDQNGNGENAQNQHNLDNHGNGHINRDFGPWMMVKRYGNKKKIPMGGKEVHSNQKQVSKFSLEKDESPKRKDSDGSRFSILNEETLDASQFLDMELGKTHKIKKKPMPPTKYASEPGGKPNPNRSKERIPGSATLNPKEMESPSRADKGKATDPEREAMEILVKENMKRMEQEKWEAFISSKNANMILDRQFVRDNLLFTSEENQPPLGGRLGTAEPRGSQAKQTDVLMIEAGSRDSKGESSSRDLTGPERRAPAHKGVGSKAFPSIIRDLRQEYEASFLFLLETHVSGSRGQWDVRKLQEVLPEDIVKRIVGISPPSPWKEADYLAWSSSPDGQFSIKSAYQNLMESQITTNRIFRLVWMWQGPERVKTFLWLVAHNAILTNAERRCRHLTMDGTCPRCQHHDESTIHVLRDCPYATSIWKRLIPPKGINSFFNTNLNDWLSLNLASNSSWACLFGVAVSSLWFFRNKLVFNSELVDITAATFQIQARAQEFRKVMEKNLNPRNTQASSDCLIGWSRPEGDCVKLNVDGSWFAHQSNAACGGVFRDSTGRFLKGYSGNLGNCSIMHAELWAVVHGLTIAAANGYMNMIVESDSAAAINFIEHGCSPAHHCAPLVQDIRNLSARLQQTSWKHALREANTVADHLAKKGQDLPLGLHLFDKAPPDIEYAILCDCIGTLRVRGT